MFFQPFPESPCMNPLGIITDEVSYNGISARHGKTIAIAIAVAPEALIAILQLSLGIPANTLPIRYKVIPIEMP